MEKTKVMVVDDQNIFLSAFTRLLGDEDDLEIVAKANNVQGARQLAEQLILDDQLDLVFMDIELRDPDVPILHEGIPCAKEILAVSKACFKDVKVLMLTSSEKKSLIDSVRQAEIHGYLMKNCNMEEIRNAIRVVQNGGKYFQAGLDSPAPLKEEEVTSDGITLTSLEMRVLQDIAKGKTIAEKADELGFNTRRVERIRNKLFQKFEVTNSPQLVIRAVQKGFLNPDNL